MEWQPIESAPQAEVVLLYSPVDGVETGYFGNVTQVWYGTNADDPMPDQPTDWMPLPAPPNTDRDKGEA